MEGTNKFSLRQRLKSFKYAAQGIKTMLCDEPNARIHIIAAVLAVAAAVILHCSTLEWVSIVLCIGMVLAAEAVNTAIENLSNRVSTQKHPLIKKAKDTAAAAVLILAITSVVVALLVFIPKFIHLLHK